MKTHHSQVGIQSHSYSAIMTSIFSLRITRVVGYSLLLMAIFNWGDILLPPQIMNPTWELQAVGAVVESVPIPLIALVLIFYGEGIERTGFERIVIRLVSYTCLLLAMIYFCLLPIAASSTMRINQQVEVQTGEIFGQQMDQLDQLGNQLDQTSEQDIVNILLNQGITLNSAQSKSPKQQLVDNLKEIRQNIQNQTEQSKADRKRSTLKSTIKWMIGAIVSACTFLYLWILTRWARSPQNIRRVKKQA